MGLPGETVAKRAIRGLLAKELTLCREMLEFGLTLHESDIINRRRLNSDTVTVVMGLFTKACVTYRAIMYLCEAGLDRPAAPISRSLFETFLNITFLLRRRVVLSRFDCRAGTKTPVGLFGRKLNTEFRTDLYCAYCMLRDTRMVGQWPHTPGLKRAGKYADKKLSTVPQPYVAAVGPDWVKRLKSANTCVGLSIADFAASMGKGFYTLYRSVYALDSKAVHQSDPLEYLNVDEAERSISPCWHTAPGQVRWMLHQSSMMFLGCLEELNKRLRFDDSTRLRISAFAAELKEWRIE